MIFKRKLFKKKQLLLKHLFLKNELKLIIWKSLYKNQYQHYLHRLFFSIGDLKNPQLCNFKSLQKLFCYYTLCKKVPSKHFSYSRFFLNRYLNSLKINNVYK